MTLLSRNIWSNIFQGIFHYFQGIFQWIFSKPCQYLNSVDQRDITFKLCFIIAAAANLLKPSRMFPPINYQLSVMKYLYLLWPLVHICMTDLRKLHILHFSIRKYNKEDRGCQSGMFEFRQKVRCDSRASQNSQNFYWTFIENFLSEVTFSNVITSRTINF